MNKASKYMAVKLPKEIESFIKSLEKSYQDKNFKKIRTYFSNQYLHEGEKKEEYISKLKSFFRYSNPEKIIVTNLFNKGGLIEIAGFGITDKKRIYIRPWPSLHKSNTLKKEKGKWKLYGNQKKRITGTYLESISLTTILEPQNLKLYKSLLSPYFEMPDKPLIRLSIVHMKRVALPLTPYKLVEVSLLVKYYHETGWFVLAMPETDWLPVEAGKVIGFPKFVVDKIDLNQKQNVWKGFVKSKGQTLLSMSFKISKKIKMKQSSKPYFLILKKRNNILRVSFEILSKLSKNEAYEGEVDVIFSKNQKWPKLLPEKIKSRGILIKSKNKRNLKIRSVFF